MKVPEPRKLKSGSYFIQLRLNGVSVPVTASTARECKRQAELIKAEHRAEKRVVQAKDDRTLDDVLQAYIDKYEKVLSPATIRSYDSYRRNRFKKWMKKPVKSISNWQDMINEETGLVSQKTVKNAWGFVSVALKEETHIAPPNVKLAQVPVKEIAFLQPDEIRVFLDAIKGNVAEIAALLELHGLRRSEVLGLDWKDIDLKSGLIHIREAKVQNKRGEFVKKDTNKNYSSTRTIPIMIPRLAELLESETYRKGPVVTIAANTMLRNVKETCDAAHITRVGNHGLRHSFASLGYHLGLSERELMKLGGWADYQTMHKVYIRVAEKDEKAAENKIAKFFKNANENANSSEETVQLSRF